MNPEERQNVVKRNVIFSGKSNPGYLSIKRIIKLINNIADYINKDPDVYDLLKVVFIPNYNVATAQLLVPAADICEQLSAPGTESSGTGNMKFVMNGALMVGSWDGANIEIAQEVGEENVFMFGTKYHELNQAKHNNVEICQNLQEVFDILRVGMFGGFQEFAPLIENFTNENDYYLLCSDFESYCRVQDLVENYYINKKLWMSKSILAAVRMGKFSSDRTIKTYAENIWDLRQLEVCKRESISKQAISENST